MRAERQRSDLSDRIANLLIVSNVPMVQLMNPGFGTIEIEAGRFARYVGRGRWESYFQSRRGARHADGPLQTSDVLARLAPESLERQEAESIIACIDG